MRKELALFRPALYNPALWSREEVKVYFTARHALLERILDDLRRERSGSPPQHRLVLGLRGMGKSTLLRRLAIAVEEDGELSGQWLPLTFPEEQYNVAGLTDLWLNCLDALGDWLEGRGDAAAAAELDLSIEKLDKKDGEAALQALLAIAQRLKRRVLLLLDNIDLILDRIKDQHWVLRETLQAHPEILVIGASANVLEASYRYDAAFYDFFKVDELRGLSEEEMRDALLSLARLRGADEVVRRIEAEPARLRVLHTLTGGNPRTVVLLYGVLLKGVDGDVRADLEALLDEVTPLYKARFEELPTQGQQLLDKLALHWDPMTARQLADAIGWEINPTSAQLNRLVEMGVVEKVRSGSGKRAAFQVGERFFNIWYLMRASRRVRRKLVWLVEFLRLFYSADELQQAAHGRLGNQAAGLREAEFELALSQVLAANPLARALETHALQTLLGSQAKLEEILDLHGEDKHLLPKAERIRALQDIRAKMQATMERWEVDFDKEVFLERFMGSPLPLLVKQYMAVMSTQWNTEMIQSFERSVAKGWQKYSWNYGEKSAEALYRAIGVGEMDGEDDLLGAEAASARFQCPMLAEIPKILSFTVETAHSEQAESILRRAMKQEPLAVLPRVLWSFGLTTLGRYEEAEAMARQVIELTPQAANGWLALGVILEALERYDQAEAAFRQAVKLEPRSAQEWCILAGLLYLRTEKHQEAEAAARRALELEPDSMDGLLLLSATLFSCRQNAEALARCRRLFELADDVFVRQRWEGFLRLFSEALATIQGQELLQLMDETEAGQRWRPLREALAAAVAGSADVLLNVAPEVRKPALEILARIAPELEQRIG